MPTALPLRVNPDGKLDQQDDLDATLGIVQIMVGTSAKLWAHAPWFGLFELFNDAARRDKQEHEALKDAINSALTRLGVDGFRVQSVMSGEILTNGRRKFNITLMDREGRAAFGDVQSA